MSFNFDLALSKFKQAWAETPLETQQEIRDRLLKAIELDDSFDFSFYSEDYDGTPFYNILLEYEANVENGNLIKLFNITISANDDLYSYDEHNLGLAA